MALTPSRQHAPRRAATSSTGTRSWRSRRCWTAAVRCVPRPRAVGLTHTTVSRALEQGRLRAPNRPVPEPHGSGSRPSARSAGDAVCAGGIGVKRTQERVRASTGQLAEAPPRFEAAETVAGAGVLLALPALLQHGLLDVTEGLYGRLNNGFFGLRSVLLTLAFMALLRITSPEQLKAHAPGGTGIAAGPGPRAGGQDGAPQAARNRRAQALAHAGRRLCPALGPG